MKKLVLFVMTTLLMFSLAGCGSKENNNEVNREKAGNEDIEETDGETEEEEECTGEGPTTKKGMTVDYKPVIYLYPEEEMEVSVKLDYKGKLTSTYPAYKDGWNVIAKPDGTLYSEEIGREYYCLFWEGISDVEYDFSKGFVVAGSETEEFLEEKLAVLGLTEKEANEFIIYWLPQMEGNAYNLISFQNEVYIDNAKLEITPSPDTEIRVFMAWQGLDEYVEVEPQELESVKRVGFTVVEWGGSER